MQIFILPMRNDFPAYKFKIDLSSVIYTLFVRYNTRMQRWFIDVMDATETPIVMGLPIILGELLYGRFVMLGLPTGSMVLLDDTGQENQPTKNSFGNTHSLLYVDPNA